MSTSECPWEGRGGLVVKLVRLLEVRSYYEGGNGKNEALGAIAGKQDRPAESLNYSTILAQVGLK